MFCLSVTLGKSFIEVLGPRRKGGPVQKEVERRSERHQASGTKSSTCRSLKYALNNTDGKIGDIIPHDDQSLQGGAA